MSRKKWTEQVSQTEEVFQSREKRKWQIAFRRYILEGSKSSQYAPYFILPYQELRQWIEMQFDNDLTWENFSDKWHFEHILPVSYFDFAQEEDLRLCWNFVNIRVERQVKDGNSLYDLLAAKAYFTQLYQQTGYDICSRFIQRIAAIERKQADSLENQASFIQTHKPLLDATATFTPDDFERLNAGMSYSSLLYEKEFLRKIGS